MKKEVSVVCMVLMLMVVCTNVYGDEEPILSMLERFSILIDKAEDEMYRDDVDGWTKLGHMMAVSTVYAFVINVKMMVDMGEEYFIHHSLEYNEGVLEYIREHEQEIRQRAEILEERCLPLMNWGG